MAANKDFAVEMSEKAQAAGCRVHRFAIGAGFVLAVDEWETPEQFQAFFSAPELQAVMGQMGAQGEPEITFGEPKGFPGEF
jgi:hypothetical protein